MKKNLPLLFLLFLFLSFPLTGKSYQPDFDVQKFYAEHNTIEFIDTDSYVVLMPKNDKPGYYCETGIIFYPGGAVDYHAYIPLVTRLAERGAACFIAKMPLDFAFMDKRAAGRFTKKHPEIRKWYMAGHSLGGAMAASYISRHSKDFKGLILLASFSTHDLSSTTLRVLSIYGSI